MTKKINSALVEKSYLEAAQLGHPKASYRLAELSKTRSLSSGARTWLYRLGVENHYSRSMTHLEEFESKLQNNPTFTIVSFSSADKVKADKIALLINAAKLNDVEALFRLYELVHWQRLSKADLAAVMSIEAMRNIPLARDEFAIKID